MSSSILRSSLIAPIRRTLFTSSLSSKSSSNFSRPSPPPLPPAEQAEFDALLKANQSIGASPAMTTSPTKEQIAELEAIQHKDVRKGPRRDFEGDVNPVTGEEGGPKVDPFKAGTNDWQYGGRITDF